MLAADCSGSSGGRLAQSPHPAPPSGALQACSRRDSTAGGLRPLRHQPPVHHSDTGLSATGTQHARLGGPSTCLELTSKPPGSPPTTIPPSPTSIRSCPASSTHSNLDPSDPSNPSNPFLLASTTQHWPPFPPAGFTLDDVAGSQTHCCSSERCCQLPSPNTPEQTAPSQARQPSSPLPVPCRPSPSSPTPTHFDRPPPRYNRRQPMARKRRPKRRETQRQRQPHCKSETMSSDDFHASNSGRQSSEGTLSEHTTSDGAHTAMTSVLGTDEELMEDMDEDSAEDLSDHGGGGDDLQSLQTASHYPQVSGSHRMEMPYLTTESIMGNSDIAASTRSLWALDLDYRDIHGRTYCREWFMPIDEIEQLRLSLNHQVFLHVLGGEHSTIQLEDPMNILDVGTGTGEWAIKMAEMYPDCEVVGTDIAAIAETKSVPMNVFFEIEDAEDWDRSPDFYDLIHFRSMEGAFRDWKFLYDNVFYSLKPGGWVELQDFDTTEGLNRFLEQFSPESPIHTLFSDLAIAAEKSGRPRGNGHMDPRLFMDAGFVDVRATEYLIPITIAEKSAGKIWLISCLDALEALCLRLLTEHMGWDPEKCKAACESAAREMAELAKNPEKSKGMVVKVCVVVGRKPFDAPATSPPHTRKTQSPSPETLTDQTTPTAA